MHIRSGELIINIKSEGRRGDASLVDSVTTSLQTLRDAPYEMKRLVSWTHKFLANSISHDVKGDRRLTPVSISPFPPSISSIDGRQSEVIYMKLLW